MNAALAPFLWVVLTFIILLFMQRWIHTHLHGVSMLLTNRSEWAVILYALILLPGVFLHEASHWITARLLGVRTGSFSLVPQRQRDGSIRLGYVEYYKGRGLGPVRESLIGGAPLLAGTAVILLIGFRIFTVTDLAAAIETGHVETLVAALRQTVATNDALVWVYLIFAVSNAMMPSPADRRAWPAFLLIMTALTLLLLVSGFSDEFLATITEPAATIFYYLGVTFSTAVVVDLLFIIAIAITEWIVSHVRGVSIVYTPRSPDGK